MKKKIFVLVVTMLMVLSAIVIIHSDTEVEASGGEGGGSGSGNNGIGLDNGFVWNVTRDLSDIIRTEYDIKKGDIPKGRAWGTDGDRHAQNLTEAWMKNESYCGLSEVQKITIGYLDEHPERNYSSKIVVNDFRLSISHPNKNYPFENPMPLTELFPIACGYKNHESNTVTYNYSMDEEDNVKIFRWFEPSENRGINWPIGGTLTNYSLNVSCEILNKYETIIGNVSYIESSEQIPDFQEGMVFMMNESTECEEKIANITNASGCILIYNETRDYAYQKASDLNLSAIRINETDNDNLTDIIDMLKNNETMIVDNVLNEDVVTFTYNLDEPIGLPFGDFMFLSQIRDPLVIESQYEDWKQILKRAWVFYWLNLLPNRQCHGFIIYDSFDTHFMTHAMRDWRWFGEVWGNRSPLPVFSVNYSVGNWIWENTTPIIGNAEASGYLNQTYAQQTTESPGVISYNVVGYRNISNNPDNSTVIISSRIDGMWGETPGDSGTGNAVMLGIAKYFNENDITPKHNLTFLMTTGEEYGMRGAHHFKDSHKGRDGINYILWLGTDELAMEQEDLVLNIGCQYKEHKKIVEIIINETDYEERNQYKYGKFVENRVYGGTEAGAWRKVCNTIVFAKEATRWRGYHRTGANYTKGDVLDEINRTDLNVTFEAFWNVTKYFTVDPDCWYKNADITVTDSDDEGTLVDTVTISYDIRSILPHDLAMNLNSLNKVVTSGIVANETTNFTINRSEISKSFSITLPSDESPGFYVFNNKIFNSTGRINEILSLYPSNYNQSTYSDFIFLYPYGYNYEPPVITNISASPDPVGYGGSVIIRADVTSNNSSIDSVKVYIYKTEDDPEGTPSIYTMNNTVGDTYEYVFNDTWQHGQYNYTIWAEDANGNETGSSMHSFNVSTQATVSVCTGQDEYGNNTWVNITDPPSSPPQVGYELLDDGDVLHIWNCYDSYYFDTNSGIQLTNHFNEYWSHNVLMLGYYNNDEWNLIYRTD